MSDRANLLRRTMLAAGCTQSELARLSGVRQPSISQTLTGKIEISDDQLDRLLSCMGYRLEVAHSAVTVDLTGSERRSWLLHRELARRLDKTTLSGWRPTIEQNLVRLRKSVRGEPHERNVRSWAELIESQDVGALHRVLTGLDRASIEMREVSPLSGLLTETERTATLARRR